METKSDFLRIFEDGLLLYRAEIDLSEITNFGWHFSTNLPNLTVRFVRGNKSPTVERLFDEFAAALQFPYYFGENWAAFDECIADLEWLEGDTYMIVVTTAHRLLAEEPLDHLNIFFECIAEAGRELNEQNKKLIVILQDTREIGAADLRYLTATDAPFRKINIEEFGKTYSNMKT